MLRREQNIPLGRQACEPLLGVVLVVGEVPRRRGLAVLAHADDAAGPCAHGEGIPAGVVLNVLVAAVDAVGDGGQVGPPELLPAREVVLDEEVVARDVCAAGVKGGAGVDNDGQAAEGVDLDAAGVEDRVVRELVEGDGLCDLVGEGVVYGDCGVVQDAT